TSSTRQAITADSGGNDFTGTLHVTAGDTTIRDANALSVVLDTGATTLTAGQALTLGGSADRLVTDSAALVFGAMRVAGDGRFTARGPVSQLAGEALQVGGTSRFDAGSQALSLTEAGNSFGGLVTLKAGDTALRGSDSLNVALDNTGATTLTAGQALTLGGTAASLVTDSAALVFGTTRVVGDGRFTARGPVSQRAGQALQVGGASAFDAGSEALSLSEAGNSFGGLVTLKAGDTALRGSDSLNVALDNTGATTLTAGQALTVGGTAASLVTDSAALVFDATRVNGDGRFTARGPVSQRAGQTLQVGGASAFDAGSDALSLTEAGNSFGGLVTLKAGDTALRGSDSLDVALDNTGATTLTAGQALTLGGMAASLVTDSAALVFDATRVTGDGRFTARGPVSQLAGQALQVGGTSRFDAGSQALSLTEAGNSFGALVTLKAGETALRGSDSLNVALDITGATTLTAGQALTLGGTAASLVTDSTALVFGTTRVAGDGRFTARGTVSQRVGEALQMGGTSRFDAGSQALSLTEAGNSFGGPVTVIAAQTALSASERLDAVLVNTGATTLIAGDELTVSGTAASLTTTSGALRFGKTTLAGAGDFTVHGSVSQDDGSALEIGGATTLKLDLQADDSIVLANSGNAFNAALGGRIDLGPAAADSIIHSRNAVRLGDLSVLGKGLLEIRSAAVMGTTLVQDVRTQVAADCSLPQSCVSVQSSFGTPQQLSVHEASIAQQVGTRIATGPDATLSLRASGAGSIDLSADAAVEVTPAGGVASSVAGLAGFFSVYSKAGPEARTLTHGGGTTNRIEGPLAAFTQADTTQQSADKTAVVVASDTIRVAAQGIDADTVMLMAREVVGGGGKIQTHVAATAMSDGRNIATGVDGKPNPLYSILPSIFVVADGLGDPAASYSFGSLRDPISISFGYVGTPVANSLLQTIAVEPYRRGDPAGAVPVYLDTRLQAGNDPTGPIRRFLVFPAGTPTGSIRMVVVDGVEILDSSAFASVQSAVAELLNQVRKEQLESGFSNENVAAQLRKGVITETRVGPAAVDRFQGVAPAHGCVGTMIGEMMVCAPSAGPQQP
ncbi:MAG: hypothetical protein JNL99_02450, partial [Zoogloea sp.]|nr:hypothetical protein [Zoogloea sp.]